MKRTIIAMICFNLIAGIMLLAGDLSFETFKGITKNAVPKDFSVNEGKVRSSRSFFAIEYRKDEMGQEALIFELNPKSTAFSAMQLAMDHSKFKIEDREAIYLDGSKTGMSSISIILKNNRGRFTIRHKNIGGTAWDKAGLEKILANIKLADLEQ